MEHVRIHLHKGSALEDITSYLDGILASSIEAENQSKEEKAHVKYSVAEFVQVVGRRFAISV